MSEISYAMFSNESNKQLILKLTENGNVVHSIPPIITIRNDLDEETSRVLKSFASIDWLVFTDVFTVDYFVEFLTENQIDPFNLDAIRICAFGEAVSDRLRFSEIHADIIATSIESNAICNSMMDYIQNASANTNVIVLKRLDAKIGLTELLTTSDFKTTEIANYRGLEPEPMIFAKTKALIAGGAIDELVFTDPSDFVGLKMIFNEMNIKEVLAGIRLSVVNKLMFQMLFEFGLECRFFGTVSS
jgi:uroporphyrinogen-III synthase